MRMNVQVVERQAEGFLYLLRSSSDEVDNLTSNLGGGARCRHAFSLGLVYDRDPFKWSLSDHSSSQGLGHSFSPTLFFNRAGVPRRERQDDAGKLMKGP